MIERRGPSLHNSSFVHLHVHTEYSQFDGLGRVEQLVGRAQYLGMPALAITDHGTMAGVWNFYKTCIFKGIKPLLGCEIYLSDHSRFERDLSRDRFCTHLTLIAKNLDGYFNLCRLVSQASQEGYFWGRPRADRQLLRENAQGLICLSGCLLGAVCRALKNGDPEGARSELRFLQDTFGDDCFLEMMNHGLPEQEAINPQLLDLAREFSMLPVATNDVHYLNKEDASIHEMLVCTSTRSRLNDPKRLKLDTQELYLKTREEMLEAFAFCPEAVDNSLLVAQRVNYQPRHCDPGVQPECQLNQPPINCAVPPYPTFEDADPNDYLAEVCERGWARIFNGDTPPQEYTERLAQELKAIKERQLAPAFLHIWSYTCWARRQDIMMSPGNGRLANSLVAYLIGLTTLDPLRYALPYELLLNDPQCAHLLTVEIPPSRHQEALCWWRGRFGYNSTAFTCLEKRLDLRDALEKLSFVLNVYRTDADRLLKALPGGDRMTLAEAREQNPKFNKILANDKLGNLALQADKLRGLPRDKELVPDRLLVAHRPLNTLLPLENGPQGQSVCQIDLTHPQKITYFVQELLGPLFWEVHLPALPQLDAIQQMLTQIRLSKHKVLRLDRLPLDDQLTFQYLSQEPSADLLYLDCAFVRDYLSLFKPQNLEDLAIVMAFYRPYKPSLALRNMANELRERRQGLKPYSLPAPLQSVLGSTCGFCLYAEQSLQALETVVAQPQDQQAELMSLLETIPAPDLECKGHLLSRALILYYQAYLYAHYQDVFAGVEPTQTHCSTHAPEV